MLLALTFGFSLTALATPGWYLLECKKSSPHSVGSKYAYLKKQKPDDKKVKYNYSNLKGIETGIKNKKVSDFFYRMFS